ncbi:MAG: TauD/TfdA family dioxygenase [Gammaproteobacteria bacterium]|nr:TauD/TfdA family dioxygenase [Gammaproteobacteria bacterium]
MSQFIFESLHPDFGARVEGVDLTAELSDDVVRQFHEAIDTYSLLWFPAQPMTDAAQLVLTRRLGEPEAEHVTLGKTGEVVYFGTVGNITDSGEKQDGGHPRTRYQTGNELWHSDSSFRRVPSYVSINHAYEAPGEGGATEFVSMRAAYARLPAEMQAEIDPLHAIHDYVFSRTQRAPVDPNHAASLPPVEQKLVRVNRGNGLKNYYVGSHARSIVGWTGIESRKLLDDLLARTTRAQDIYPHQWRAGDTVIWDNRCLLHRGAGYDADRWRRRMRQTRVAGRGPTVEE